MADARPALGTNIVEVYINYLRKKPSRLSDNAALADSRCVIRTVRGKGYLLGKLGIADPLAGLRVGASETDGSFEQGWAAEGWVVNA